MWQLQLLIIIKINATNWGGLKIIPVATFGALSVTNIYMAALPPFGGLLAGETAFAYPPPPTAADLIALPRHTCMSR